MPIWALPSVGKGGEAARCNVEQLDPTQQDRWWRRRIGQEEKTYGGAKPTDPPQPPGSMSTSYLSSFGAYPKVAKPDLKPNQRLNRAANGLPRGPESMTGSMAGGGTARKEGGSVASGMSYPRTPQFSAAGSAGEGEIMTRLSKLEGELTVERQKRQAAQDEMKELLFRVDAAAAAASHH